MSRSTQHNKNCFQCKNSTKRTKLVEKTPPQVKFIQKIEKKINNLDFLTKIKKSREIQGKCSLNVNQQGEKITPIINKKLMAKQRRKNVRQNLVKNLMSKKQFFDPKYSKRIVNPSKFDQVKQNSFTNKL